MKPIHTSRLVLATLAFSAATALAQPAPASAAATEPSQTPTQTPAATPAATQAGQGAATAENAAAPAAPLLPASRILPSSDTSTPVGSTLTGSLEAGRVANTIQTQELDQRDELLKELADRVGAADRRVSELRQNAATVDEAGKKALDAATAEYEKMKAQLQQSMENARSAERAQWDRTRARLATDYAFYAASVGAVEVALPN